MKPRAFALVLGMRLLAPPMFAADVDGKWNGSFETLNGGRRQLHVQGGRQYTRWSDDGS